LGIDVFLRTIDGKKKELIPDPDGLLTKAWPINDPGFPLLQYIDPYGDTIFGGTQMPQIEKELKVLLERTSDDRLRDLMRRVLDFAVRAGQHPHMYLWFSGD
jgi:hypothetical protein